jgi:molecular chaperone DnaK
MAVNGDDKNAIEMRQKALQDAYSHIMQAEQSQQKAQSKAGQQENTATSDSANDDVIDADFEDVSNG